MEPLPLASISGRVKRAESYWDGVSADGLSLISPVLPSYANEAGLAGRGRPGHQSDGSLPDAPLPPAPSHPLRPTRAVPLVPIGARPSGRKNRIPMNYANEKGQCDSGQSTDISDGDWQGRDRGLPGGVVMVTIGAADGMPLADRGVWGGGVGCCCCCCWDVVGVGLGAGGSGWECVGGETAGFATPKRQTNEGEEER